MSIKILLTGRPGCGKTILIRRVIAQLLGPMDGFYTQEIRSGGRRVGFQILTLDGQRGVLAHVDLRSRYRVSKYRVDLAALDALAVPAIYRGMEESGLVVMDEISPMEILSPHFRQAVLDALESPVRANAASGWGRMDAPSRVRPDQSMACCCTRDSVESPWQFEGPGPAGPFS